MADKAAGRIKLTAGDLGNYHLCLARLATLIPASGVGGSSPREPGTAFTVVFQPGSTVLTDVAGDTMILRDRKGVRDFFESSAADVGDVVVVERSGDRTLTIWLEQDLSDGALAVRDPAVPIRSDVSGQLARADQWINETFAEMSEMANVYAVSHRDEFGPGRQFRFSNGGYIKVHPRLSKRIVLGFPKRMREELDARGVLIDREDLAWMNFDQGMDMALVRELIELAAR